MTATGATTTTPEVGPDLVAPATGRLQLALNVDDLDAAIEFYSRMFIDWSCQIDRHQCILSHRWLSI